MIRRLFWMVAGAATMFWCKRQAEQIKQRLAPRSMARTIGTSAKGRFKQVGAGLRAAASEGREAMQEREHFLRSSGQQAQDLAPH